MLLETDELRAEIDATNGAVLQFTDKRCGAELISDPRLGEAFVLVYSSATSHANEITSNDQRPPQVSQDGSSVTLRWAGPLTSGEDRHEISVEVRLGLIGASMLCRLEVENRSQIVIEECRLLRIGGVASYGGREGTRLVVPLAGTSAGRDLFHDFRTANGRSQELGTPVAENLFVYPGELPMPWADLSNEDLGRGISFQAVDDVPRLRCLQIAVHPGIGHLRSPTWPLDSIDADVPAGLTVRWVTFPYLKPGATFKAPVVSLNCHKGDWHEAGADYRTWFAGNKAGPRPGSEDGIRSCGAILDTMFLLPEGNVKLRFSDMRKWARDAADHGVTAVLASGWDMGGHDSMYPYYEPDPRLGTWEELERGIAACHDEGVKVFLFVNLQAVDCSTDWYREELHKFRTMDPWGSTEVMGWGMGTVAARMGATRRPIVLASPGFPEYRQLITDQFRRLASIGADGIHIDKLAWSHRVQLDFNPALVDPPDLAIWKGILEFLGEVVDACCSINPAFTISHEGTWDELLAYSNVGWAWHSTWERDYEAIFKFVFPEWLPALSITQPGDFNVVNSAVRYGCQMLIGPGNYTSGMAYSPMGALAAYIKEVNAIRQRYRGTLLHGRYQDQRGAVVAHGPDVRYATHAAEGGQLACVIVNYGRADATVRVDDLGPGPATVISPFETARVASLPFALSLPPERMAVVIAGTDGSPSEPRDV